MKTISTAEAARVLGIDEVLLERRVRAGKLVRLGDGYFSLQEVETLVNSERERDEAWSVAMQEMEESDSRSRK